MKEAKILFTILVAIVALAWVASNFGLIEMYESYQQSSVAKEDTATIPNQSTLPEPIVSEDYLQMFNGYRVENQLQPLVIDANLNELAWKRCLEISQDFSHEGIQSYNLGENIAKLAYSSDSNYQLLELWASSPKHSDNMLRARYIKTGFARIDKYAVQLFASEWYDNGL